MAKTTTSNEDDFVSRKILQELVPFDCTFLLELIQSSFEPDEIYDNGELDQWADNNEYYTKSGVFSKFEPEEIYDARTLKEWALANGYVKKDE